MKIENNIKNLREELGITQLSLAKNIGFSQSIVCDWENNKVEPSSSAIIAMAQFFNVSTDFLLGLTDEKGNRLF